jgi:hypothetical protein
MNVPIRVLGIATVIFWIFLIAFVCLAGYSIKDLNLGAGEPQLSVTSDGQLLFSLPMYVDNKGVCDLKDLHISTVFTELQNAEISQASTFVPNIRHGQNVTIVHNVTLNLNDLLSKGERYLFEDSDLEASVTAGLTFAEVLPVEISTNFTYPWGAPFYNFSLGKPSFDLFNSTYGRMSVPVSFENHAAFDIVGNIRMQLYDSSNSFLGESQTAFNATQRSSYDGSLDFCVPLSSASLSPIQGGYFDVYFSTSLFEYGPVVMPYG